MTSGTKKVLVLMGGWSAERDVSLDTGESCVSALTEAGYDVVSYDLTRDLAHFLDTLKREKPDVVFNALHGRWGEDGTVQGLLDLLDIPYTHSGVLASALAMDKVYAKQIFHYEQLPTPKDCVVNVQTLSGKHPMALPYVIKPINEGSSVGVFIIKSDADLVDAQECWDFGERALVEEYIPGREITVGIVGDRPIGTMELRPKVEGFYDYAHKYTEGFMEHLVPAPLPKAVEEALFDYALRAHKALDCKNFSRVDFRYDDTEIEPEGFGKIYLLEVNTQPGCTSVSIVPELAEKNGIPFPELCKMLVEDAKRS